MANEYIKDTNSACNIYFYVGNKVLTKIKHTKQNQSKYKKSSLITSLKYTMHIRIFTRMFQCAVQEMKTNITEVDLNHKSPKDEPCFFADLR